MIEALFMEAGKEALMDMAKQEALKAMGPELAALGGAEAAQGMSEDIGGLLGQTQSPQMFNQTPAGTMSPTSAAAPTPAPTGVMDTLQNNVMSDFNKSTLGQAYNTVTNPNATAKDYTSLGYKMAFSPDAEKQNQSSMVQMPSMQTGGGYGGRVNTAGGIPDLLKQYNYNPGILQYLG